ncbi:MAG TPA: hypothetical protein PKA81_15080 [Clostridia bacterium]|nr:hypothetical protein [Clostridia bacterium]
MHLYERPRGQYRGLAFAAVVFVLLAAVFLLALATTTQRSEARETEMVTAAIQRGIVTCYAVEGKYPPSLSYLYEHYGVSVDESRYAVFYDVIAANLMPSVQVSRIGGGS